MARNINTNWIVSFATALSHISEAPAQFNIWAGMSAVGAVLKNKIYLKHGTYTIYPNQYIVLVSPPGIGKGQAIHPPYNIAKEQGLINVISDRITAPRIIERLASGTPSQLMSNQGALHMGKDGSAVLFSTELPTLLTSSDWMLQFLCDAWDRNEFYYDTKNSGSATIKGMCTSLIGACTPDYIKKLNRDAMAAINSGFTARTVFVYAEDKSKIIPWPKSLEDSASGRKAIKEHTEDLSHISTLSGPVSFSPDAKLLYEQSYKTMVTRIDDDTEVVLNFRARMPVHILKTAMIMSAAENDSLYITRKNMYDAFHLVGDVLKNLDRAFRGVGESSLAENQAKVEDLVERRLVMTRESILSQVYRNCSVKDLDEILQILTLSGRIKAVNQGGKVIFKPAHKLPPVANTSIQSFLTSFGNGVNNGNGKVNP